MTRTPGSPPTIAFVSLMEGAAWGGSEELWSATAAELLRRGGRAVLSSLRWPQPAAPIQALVAAGAMWHPWMVPAQMGFGARLMLTFARRSRAFASGLHRRISSFRPVLESGPDVICVNQGGTFDLLRHASLLEILRTSGIPYAILCRSTDESTFLSEQDRALAIPMMQRAAFLGFASQAGIETTERHLGCRLPNACVIQSPIRISDSNRLPPPDGTEFRFAFVARLLAAHKGQDLALQTLSSERWKSRAWRLTFFGEGPDRAWLEQLTSFYGLQDRVTFAGHVSDIAGVWKTHHLGLLPSRSEGTPQALIQAMLCGRPVVATDIGGIGEWAIDNETAFIATGCTRTALDDALERAWNARDRWAGMGEKAHAVAVARRQPDPHLDLLARLTALAGTSAPSRCEARPPAGS